MNYSELRFSEREVVYVKRRRNGEIIQLNSCEEQQCLILRYCYVLLSALQNA